MAFNELPPLPFDVPAEVLSKASRIKLALFDVDGVLTDGKLHYGAEGETLKVFHALDGHGLKMLQQAGISVGVITARKSNALALRLKDLSIEHVYMGVRDKADCFSKLLVQLELDPMQCAFTGDDVIDLPVMHECGLKLAVANAHFIVKHYADWVSPFTGGAGAVRSICDLLLYSQNTYPIGKTTTQ